MELRCDLDFLCTERRKARGWKNAEGFRHSSMTCGPGPLGSPWDTLKNVSGRPNEWGWTLYSWFSGAHLCPRLRGHCFLSPCVRWRTRHKPSSEPAEQTQTWAGSGPQRCTGSSGPVSVTGAADVGDERSSTGAPARSRQRQQNIQTCYIMS